MIEKEQGPYEFKLYLFPEDQNQWSRDLEADMRMELEEELGKYGVDYVDFRFSRGSKYNEKAEIKLICHFAIDEQKSALQCFDEIS